jgi:hypothetical protein
VSILAGILALVIVVFLIALAIYKKDCVSANFKMWPFSFSFEAKNLEAKKPVLPSS